MTSQFTETNQTDFLALVAQHTLTLINQNFYAFFALLKLKAKGEDQGSQAASTKAKPGYIKLSQTNIFIKSKVEKVQFVRVVQRKSTMTVEIGYKKNCRKKKV